MMLKRYSFVTGAALAFLLLTAGCGGTTLEAENLTITQAQEHTLLVQSTETVRAAPDKAEVTFIVETTAEDPQDCQQQNMTAVQQVIDALKNMGIEEKYLQTSDYSLNPQYDYNGGTETLIGYQMWTEIKAEGLELLQTGKVLQTGVSAGANRVQNVKYFISNYEEHYAEALELAMKSAREKAEVMAAADGCSIEGISKVEEFEEDNSYRYVMTDRYAETALMAAAEDTGDSPVMAGELEVEANIQVTYLISNQE